MAEEEAIKAAEKTAVEERLRKKATVVKNKKVVAPSIQPAAEITEDVYLAAFYANFLFEILDDPAQLAACVKQEAADWSEKNWWETLIER